MNKARNLEIDTLRGIACILLVAYHVVGSTQFNGMKVSDGFLRELNDTLAYLRMPLFTFLSGVVYAYRPYKNNARNFLLKKARRLLIPMITVGTSFAVLQSLVPGSNGGVNNWFLLHIIPYAHFWFIESLFLLFCLIVFLETYSLFDNVYKYILIMVVVSLLYISPFSISYFSLSGFLYLTPYFFIGMGMIRYKLIERISNPLILFFSAISLLLLILIYFEMFPKLKVRDFLGLFVGILSCVSIYSWKLKSKALAWVGCFSYTIYLYHVFFTAGGRIILQKFGINQFEILFLCSLFIGLFGSILTEFIFSKTNFTRVMLLGKGKLKNT